jgi:hypothetical protein
MKRKANLRYTITQALSLAKEAMVLVETRKKAIAPRVTEGLLEALPGDIERLESMQTGRPATVIQVKGLTGTEAELSEKGAEWVRAVREAVKKRMPNSGLSKAVGVGNRLYPNRSAIVVSAIEAILKAADDYPEAIKACGILAADLEGGKTLNIALTMARNDQDLGQKDKKDLTTSKNVLQLKIEKAIKEIATAGYIHYLESEPLIAIRFKGLMPAKRAKKELTAFVLLTVTEAEEAETEAQIPEKEVNELEKAG